jgi:hypothetical protein
MPNPKRPMAVLGKQTASQQVFSMDDFPRPPFPEQQQPVPGTTDKMNPRPDHGEDSYKPKSGSWMIAQWCRIGANHRDGDRNDESGGSPGG